MPTQNASSVLAAMVPACLKFTPKGQRQRELEMNQNNLQHMFLNIYPCAHGDIVVESRNE